MLWWISFFGLSQPRLDSVFATKHSLVNTPAFIMELLSRLSTQVKKAGPFLQKDYMTVIFLAVSFVHEPGSAYCPTHFPSKTPVCSPLCDFTPVVSYLRCWPAASRLPPQIQLQSASASEHLRSWVCRESPLRGTTSLHYRVLPCLLCILSGCWDRGLPLRARLLSVEPRETVVDDT